MDANSRQKSYQAEYFTPKRSLARTPPKKRQETENISPNVTQEAPLIKDRKQNQAKDDKKKAQNTISTSKHATLKKRNAHEGQGKKKDSLNSAIDEIPPPSRWEIPRTPVRVVEHVQLQLATVPAHSGGGKSSPLQRTPVRIKTPAHPLAHSNKAPVRPTEGKPTVGKGGGDEGSKSVVQSIDNDKPAQEGEGTGGEDEVAVTISPPISISKGIGTLPGLNCTENDLAFLQRMQSIKKYEELKAEAGKLEKAHKTAAEQREQFQHEVLKIEHDLRDMKLTYQEAASSVNTLIANTRDTSLLAGQSPASISTTSSVLKHQTMASQSEETVLTEVKLAKLRKLNQLSSARVEKSEKEMKGKLAEVERARWQLQDKIKEEEERKLVEETELQSKLQVTKREQEKWKQKVDQEEELYTSLKKKLREAQSELAALQQETDEATVSLSASQEEDMSVSETDEKRKTEERLKRLIRRCELYIQRHQMLKEMSTN